MSYRSFVLPRILSALLLAGAALAAPPAAAQEEPPSTATDWAWKPLLEHEGVDFSFIYYAKPGSVADGVVLKLVNLNAVPVRYRFKMVFRTDGAARVEEVEGELLPRQIKTGDREGLYWVPFEDGRPIIEIGLRGYHVTRLPLPADPEGSDAERETDAGARFR